MSPISAHPSFPEADVTGFQDLFPQRDSDVPKIFKYSSHLLSSQQCQPIHLKSKSTIKSTTVFTRACPSM